MNATLGAAGVVLGVAASLLGALTMAVGLRRKRPRILEAGWSYSLLILLGAVVSVIAMQRALITRDFSVSFVHDHGSSRTPRLFNIATMWSALEGSILLWALILAGFTVHVARKFRRRLADPLVGWALLTMFIVCAFFFLLMLGPANPFTTVSVPAGFDGPGPNPLLQEHLHMAFHPPMLYLGYVGFTVPFAFAVAALVTGRLGEGWLVETRRATLMAWGFLTVGIILGAWW
ncbi:MAG TPA: cytochrome c biogenesis protein CcsA, partial [Acidimicrobiales bacterium]|nr:cytochrome c biogenesis protein CcsA [Acidimicrobiales bacterium]